MALRDAAFGLIGRSRAEPGQPHYQPHYRRARRRGRWPMLKLRTKLTGGIGGSGPSNRVAPRCLGWACRRRLHGAGGPGSVPWHNVALFVCTDDPISTASQPLHAVVAQHAGAASTWKFSAALCACAPGCVAGDILVFPHYLHLRPSTPPTCTERCAHLSPRAMQLGQSN